jgi:hypothetical protein
MSFQVPCKSKGQHLFSLLLFTGCSSGCNSGLGWASRLLRCLQVVVMALMVDWDGIPGCCVVYGL